MDNILYCGLDLHKQFSYIVVKDHTGRALARGRVENRTTDIESFFAPFRPNRITVALEATSNYYWMYETLDALKVEVKLSHPLKTRAIADAKIKSDKIDANILSDLLRADLLPTSYIPGQRTRQLRELVRHRMRLVAMRTQLKNRLRAVLIKNNHPGSFGDIASSKARSIIHGLALSEVFKLQTEDLLEHMDFIGAQIERINKRFRTYVKEMPEIERLTAINGIGIFSALVLLAEIGDITRFPSPKKLVRYAGLCPGLHQSGDTRYTTSLIHEGDVYIRWILVEAAQHAIRHPGPLRDFYASLARVKGSQKAIVAVARKMLTGIYFVLKNNAPFDPVRRKKYVVMNLDKPAGGTWQN